MFGETVEVLTPEEWPDDAGIDPTVEDMLGEHPGVPVPAPPDPSAITPSGGFALELDWATTLPTALTAAELVDAAVGYEHLAAWAIARQQELLAEFHRRPADGTLRPTTDTTTDTTADPGAGSAAKREWAVDEIGLALTLAPSQAATRMAHADRSAAALRPTRDLLATGRICPARARLITDMLAEHDDGVAAAVQARVLPRAPEHTWGQLRAALTRALLAVVPDPAHRHRAARKRRRVELWPGHDGMATLAACLTAPEATASYEWITRLARGIPSDNPGQTTGANTGADSAAGDGATGDCPAGAGRGRGSMDRRRADVLVALLTGRLIATNTATTTNTAATAGTGASTTTAATVAGDAVGGDACGSAGAPDPAAAPLVPARRCPRTGP